MKTEKEMKTLVDEEDRELAIKIRAAEKIDSGMRKNRFMAAKALLSNQMSLSDIEILDVLKRGIGACRFGFRRSDPKFDPAVLFLLIQLGKKLGVDLVLSERQYYYLRRMLAGSGIKVYVLNKSNTPVALE